MISGGRYDSLLRQFGCDLPATGFGVNVDSVMKVLLNNGNVNPPISPEILVAAQDVYDTDALKKVGELSGQGIVCEFSIFETLEQARSYAKKRSISKILSIGKSVEHYEL